MIMHVKVLVLAGALVALTVLAGCGTTTPAPAPRVEVVPVPVLAPPPDIPPECKGQPPAWPRLSDTDVMVDAERRAWVSAPAHLRSKGVYARLASAKRICAAWSARTDAAPLQPMTGPEQPGS